MAKIKSVFYALIIIFVLITILICVIFPKVSYKKMVFVENKAYLNNPSRGFYKQISSTKLKSLEELDENIRLVLLEYSIVDFKETALSEEKLAELETFLSMGEKKGVKFIFRAAYGFTSESDENDVDDIEIVKTHIKQIAPIINKYSNVIYCVQAGFIGPWGEWHSSLLFKDKSDEEQIIVRNTVIETLLQEIDSDVPIGIRRPSFIIDAKNNGIDVSRLGVHNDGLFASESDLGTYKEKRETEINQWNKMVSVPTNGGEMPAVSEWSKPERVNAEMYKMKISYLNAFYNKEVLEDWNKNIFMGENALKYIEKHLGYRLSLSEISVPETIFPLLYPHYVPLEFELVNSGYATIESCYKAEIIVKTNGEITQEIAITEIDKIDSSPHSGKRKVKIKINQDMLDEGFELGVKIYDTTVQNAPDYLYNVKLANDDIIYENGINYFYKSK